MTPFFHACDALLAGQVPFRGWTDQDQESQSPLMADLGFTKESKGSNTEGNYRARKIAGYLAHVQPCSADV